MIKVVKLYETLTSQLGESPCLHWFPARPIDREFPKVYRKVSIQTSTTMALPHTKTTFNHSLRSNFPPNYDLSGGYDTHSPIPPTPKVIKELQKKLPFLPGHQFDIEKVGT